MTTKFVDAEKFFQKTMGPMTFGMFLTAARSLLELTQVQLARKLKVSRSMICDIEKGRVIVSPSLAIKIARLAGFPEDSAIKYCLEDQLRKAKIKMTVKIEAA